MLNDFPGLDVYGYFKAGDQVGDTWLNLQVRGEEKWSAVARVDNHGSDLTGRQRLYAEASSYNPLKVADSFTVGILKTFNPDNSTYGLLRYRLPMGLEQLHLGLNYSRNQFVTAVGALKFSGDTRVAEMVLDYAFVRRKEMNFFTNFSVARKKSSLTADKIDNLDFGDTVRDYNLGLRFDTLDTQANTLHQVNASITKGNIEVGADTAQDPNYKKLNVDYSYLTFVHIPWVDATTRMIFKTSLQYTDALLPSVEQTSLSGPNRVRAFDVTQFSADSLAYAGLDWIFNMPDMLDFNITDTVSFAKIVQPFIFMDTAYGEVHENLSNNINRARLSGYGVGLQLNYNNKLSGNFEIALPNDSYFSQDSIEKPKNDPRVILDFQYIFN